MPLTSISLLNSAASLKSSVSEKSIPDYTVLFWHFVHDWEAYNSTHGSDPRLNTGSRHFRISDLGKETFPDFSGTQGLGEQHYTVRCVSDSTNWPSICDVRFGANTNMPSNQATLLDVGGAHGITLPGRTFPPLPNEGSGNPTVVPITLYNATHTGHIHQVEGLYNDLMFINSGKLDSIRHSNNSFIPRSFASFFVSPIIKDPKIYSNPVKTIPKDMIVMYYGDDTLPLDYYDQYDINQLERYPLADYSANGYCLPITFVNSNSPFDRTGAKNIAITYDIFQTSIFNITQKDIVGTNPANTVTFLTSSNSSGYHDHRVLGVQSKLVTATTGVSYTVIPPSAATTIFPPSTTSEPYPNGPDAINHKHKVTYTTELKLKSTKLTGYLSKSPNAPIVKGLILGYSIGKESGFGGLPTTGSEILPKGWYFCDGTNGTPDLRGRYPFLNFTQDGLTGIDENTVSNIEIKNIEVETINWKHGHVYKLPAALPVAGAAGAKDVGSHASNYDPSADPNNTTRHTHAVSTVGTFTQKTPSGSNLFGRPNAKVGSTVNYEPPTVEIAFIMYNDTI